MTIDDIIWKLKSTVWGRHSSLWHFSKEETIEKTEQIIRTALEEAERRGREEGLNSSLKIMNTVHCKKCIDKSLKLLKEFGSWRNTHDTTRRTKKLSTNTV